MAVQNSSKSILNINYPDISKNKVYVNPNFGRPHTNNLSSSAVMHVNPKFSHLVSNVQCNIQNKNKIYVNPDFIKSKRDCDSKQLNSVNNNIIFDRPSVYNTSISLVSEQPLGKNVSPLQVPITQSRYCLVRQNESNNVLKESVLAKPKNTFKLNKYKSVPWNDVKRNLDIVKNNSSFASRIESNSNSIDNKNISRSSVSNNRKDEFKIINFNSVSLLKQDKIKSKMYGETQQIYKFNHASQSRVKKTKGHLKKNNIPCRLFRKYGKCIRNVRGKCEFLHDKKHVAVCRKFIKGVCHDKECLLSHDLTTKKMPTCYFYLQGTCTKSDCPYLHVKLNEKTKVCPDFLKGYCEKGKKCFQRHINISSDKKINLSPQETKASLRNNFNALKTSKVSLNNFGIQDKSMIQVTDKKHGNRCKFVEVKSENSSEYRYYQEHRNDDNNTNELCEIIKPTRCKLGVLPSFIQL